MWKVTRQSVCYVQCSFELTGIKLWRGEGNSGAARKREKTSRVRVQDRERAVWERKIEGERVSTAMPRLWYVYSSSSSSCETLAEELSNSFPGASCSRCLRVLHARQPLRRTLLASLFAFPFSFEAWLYHYFSLTLVLLPLQNVACVYYVYLTVCSLTLTLSLGLPHLLFLSLIVSPSVFVSAFGAARISLQLFYKM